MTRIAIVHPTTLLGKELREALERSSLSPGLQVSFVSAVDEEIGVVTEFAGAATFVSRYDGRELEGCAVVFFCGEIEVERPLLAELPPGSRAVVLSLGAAQNDGGFAVAGLADAPTLDAAVWVSPHAGAIGICRVVSALRTLAVGEVRATILQGTSSRGQAGIDELFEETRSILAFTGQPKPRVFGRQIAFNLLPAVAESRSVADAVVAVLAPTAPRVHAQVIQGGFFHAVALSLDLSVGARPSVREVARMLSAEPTLELARDAVRLGPIDAAGQERILVGEIVVEPEGDHGSRISLWCVLDNLSAGGALNALALARPYLG